METVIKCLRGSPCLTTLPPSPLPFVRDGWTAIGFVSWAVDCFYLCKLLCESLLWRNRCVSDVWLDAGDARGINHDARTEVTGTPWGFWLVGFLGRVRTLCLLWGRELWLKASRAMLVIPAKRFCITIAFRAGFQVFHWRFVLRNKIRF